MPNNSPNSSIAGYLLPGNQILDDKLLDRFLHQLFVGVTGLDPTLVRPRWLMTPDNLVPNGDILLTQGIVRRRDDAVAYQEFREDVGMIVTRNQEFDTLCSFYGELCATYEGILRDGLSLDQNREYINSQGVVLVKVGNPRNTSELFNNHWVKRLDVEITFRRIITRVYPVLSLVAADVDVYLDAQDHEIIEHISVDKILP